MEQILDGLKDFILHNPNFFTDLADESTPMNAPADVFIGYVDLLKNKSKVLVSLIPENQTPEDEYIEGSSAQYQIMATFICRGYKSETLMRQMMRYAEGFKNLCFSDNSLNGCCDDYATTNIEYYLDAGIIDNQATAAEITIQVNKSV